jgi:hypothetical protein
MRGFRHKREFDLNDFTRRQIKLSQDMIDKFRLNGFEKVEPLFCEIFWNAANGSKVDYVPETYVRHLFLRRLSVRVSEELDQSEAWRKTTDFLRLHRPSAT